MEWKPATFERKFSLLSSELSGISAWLWTGEITGEGKFLQTMGEERKIQATRRHDCGDLAESGQRRNDLENCGRFEGRE